MHIFDEQKNKQRERAFEMSDTMAPNIIYHTIKEKERITNLR